MYLGHWSLQRLPFENVPDSRFLFPTPQHERALAALSYSVYEVREPVLLVGPPGCGKTLLLRALRRRLPRDRFRVAFVPNIDHPGIGLMERIAHHLAEASGSHSTPSSESGRDSRAIYTILRHVQEAEAAAQTVVAMLDDWPTEVGDAGMLRELRGLLDTDVENSRICAIVSGEQFEMTRNWPAALAQRLCTAIRVGPLSREQVLPYLQHRIAFSGGRRDTFTSAAGAAIAEWSRGVPRLINRLAHLSLHTAYLDLASHVEVEAVRRAAQRLELPHECGEWPTETPTEMAT